ncbi:response regulator transcription factor [Rhodocytophaga aerolata]|uniref:Response regulator transcription factor n=1 Tax=Rhodocytophaga aerolata TaxID=455078 RepID=A0ABT8REY5_9BACT|nr:response regulator transcription factor [Rhodocytophaga aerolata]MDO1450665.1 response regulator transcription factor [Rhodocytophaga aerolata]
MIKILLVDDHQIVRDGLISVLSPDKNLTIEGQAATGKEAIAFLEGREVDVVLMDINMPEMNGLEATRYIRVNFPSVKILLLTMLDKEQVLLEAVEADAHGYVLKTAGYKEILHAIHVLYQGEEYFSTDVTKMLISFLQSTSSLTRRRSNTNPQASFPIIPAEHLPDEITPRELKVLQLIAQGYTNKQMSDILFVGRRTIEGYRQKLLEKTGSTNSATLVRYAIHQGLIK